MDHIPFTKVSIEEAKASLHRSTLRQNAYSATVKSDWTARRIISDDRQPELGSDTFKWLATLPPTIRPWELAKQFPRIANRLALLWPNPDECGRFLGELMLDSRGNRKGFPQEVAIEIATLRSHVPDAVARAAKTDVWSNHPGT